MGASSKFHAMETKELFLAFETDPSQGLTSRKALEALGRFGANTLRKPETRPWWSFLMSQFNNPMVWVLSLAAVVSLFMKEQLDAAAIVVVILLNSLIGFVTEFRAERAIEALRSMTALSARVQREGRPMLVPAENVVPGDILLLEAGDIVAADSRLYEARNLAANESSLTGESMPVEKGTEPLPEDLPLADRTNCVYSGTAVVRGNARAVVFATGLDSELGKISSLLEAVGEKSTPLEEKLGKLSRSILYLVGTIAAFVFVVGSLQGRGFLHMLETGIALAVAAVPEGLPFVATMTLAIGVHRMASQNALVRNLSSVETLGSTTVICTDKTGTLTMNDMAVRSVFPVVPEAETLLYRVAVLCNNASFENGEEIGDPMEVALLKAVTERGTDPAAIREEFPRTGEVPFDSRTMTMMTSHGDYRALKGAPERLLHELDSLWSESGNRPISESERERWLAEIARIAGKGMRSLAFAWGDEGKELAFVGLTGIIDPPRPEVADSVKACHEAGIHVVMVTGDHLGTARAIAEEVGILSERFPDSMDGKTFETLGPETLSERIGKVSVIARVSPEHKLSLVRTLQEAGHTVAMTGDGVNDAVALKQADVGIAMGIQGTEVSKESSDVILEDDRFFTIVKAIAEGRRIFGNIRKSVVYLLSCNLSEVLVVILGLLLRLPAVLLPLQILWINLATDVLPALSLALDPQERDSMRRPPLPRSEGILTPAIYRQILCYGSLMALGTLAVASASLARHPGDSRYATAMAFHAIVFAQLLFVFNVRDHSLFRDPGQLLRNPWLVSGVLFSSCLQVFITTVPVFQEVLSIAPLSIRDWAIVLAGASLPSLFGQGCKILGGL